MDSRTAPDHALLMARLQAEADGCYAWSNGPGDVYAEHTHDYEKILYCTAGSITFTLRDREIRLGPGDRMALPPGTPHGAVVGPSGCACIEGRGRNMTSR
jgi:mannose-6-phosphate isomerase-like protein (cupin superfamily)